MLASRGTRYLDHWLMMLQDRYVRGYMDHLRKHLPQSFGAKSPKVSRERKKCSGCILGASCTIQALKGLYQYSVQANAFSNVSYVSETGCT